MTASYCLLLLGAECGAWCWCGSCADFAQKHSTRSSIKTNFDHNRQQEDSARQLTHGMGVFCTMCLVSSLNFLQNSIMLMPRGPRACPIAGPGLAVPAGTRILTVRTNDMLSWRPLSFVLWSQGSSSCASKYTSLSRCTPSCLLCSAGRRQAVKEATSYREGELFVGCVVALNEEFH